MIPKCALSFSMTLGQSQLLNFMPLAFMYIMRVFVLVVSALLQWSIIMTWTHIFVFMQCLLFVQAYPFTITAVDVLA